MISYSIYKIVHLLGVMMVFLSLGGVIMHAINGGEKEHSWRKPVAITHGIGLLLALVGGFGLLARLGVMHGTLPGWVLAKLGIWFVFGEAHIPWVLGQSGYPSVQYDEQIVPW